MKSILHLNADYIGNHLYSMIYQKLDNKYKQICYVPIKWNRSPKFEVKLVNGVIVFHKIINNYHRVFYFLKIKNIYNDLSKIDNMSHVSYVHAHSLFSDGAVAYKLHKRYGLKYIVAIRLTDVVLQYRFMYHRRAFANKILENAEKVIFISSIYKERLFRYLPTSLAYQLDKKSVIIPNGINEFFLEHQMPKTIYCEQESLNLLFIGRIIETKNIINVIKAVKSLSSEVKLNLTIVGGNIPSEMDYYNRFLSEINNNSFINYIGEIYDKNMLLELYKDSHLLIVPSKEELFGLVYIEAISQNTPFIYGIGTGIEPYFKGRDFCAGVDGSNIESIKKGIVQIQDRYNSIPSFSDEANEFSWNRIVNKYINIYHELD